MIFLFPKYMILFFRQKLKDHLSQKNKWKYGNFCIFGKDGISFSYKYCQKSKHDIILKNTFKYHISSITEKDDSHPRKYGISSDRKIKDDKKNYSVKYA